MTTQVEAVFQDGVLRPLQPLGLLENQKVFLTIVTLPTTTDEPAYLDTELHRYCESRADYSITLEQVRKELASIPGSIADDIIVRRSNDEQDEQNCASLILADQTEFRLSPAQWEAFCERLDEPAKVISALRDLLNCPKLDDD